jgi:hypothetical protein
MGDKKHPQKSLFVECLLETVVTAGTDKHEAGIADAYPGFGGLWISAD